MRRWIYRNLYMNSIGWKLTRLLRKRDFCEECYTGKNLHLHHNNYRGYGWLAFIFPDLISDMQTLCSRHHAKRHGSKL